MIVSGTRFGSGPARVDHDVTRPGATMTSTAVSEPNASFIPRRRDRRAGIGDLLISLSRAALDADASLARGAFEEGLRRLVPVQAVQLRDSHTRWSTRAETAAGVGINRARSTRAGARGARRARSDFEPGSRLGRMGFPVVERRHAYRRAAFGARTLSYPGGPVDAAGRGATSARRRGAAHRVDAGDAGAALAIERVAGTDFTVLLEGESGVGKELVARQIHELSRRRNGPFVAINCAALVETLLEAELFGIEERTATGVRGRRGKFEHADGGTLFLDEVSDLSLSAQAKLLRAIQDLAVERVGGQRHPPRRHPHRRGDQPQPVRAGRRRLFRAGPVLPAERRRRPCAAAARAPRRHPRARASTSSNGIGTRGRCRCRRPRPRRSSPTTGRATCASSSD